MKEDNTKVEMNLNKSERGCQCPGPLEDLQKSSELPSTLTCILGSLFGL